MADGKKISQMTALASASVLTTDEIEVARSSSASSFRLAMSALATYVKGLAGVPVVGSTGTFSSTVTVQAGGLVVTAGGLTVSAGTTTVQALTAAGISATSVTLSGGNALVFSTAQARIIPGATDIAFNNNANTFNNLLITDAGNVTVRGTFAATSASFTSSVTVANGQYFMAKRLDGVPVNALGYGSGTSMLEMILGGGTFRQIDTGNNVVRLANYFTGSVANNGTTTISNVPSFSSFWVSDITSNTSALYCIANGVMSIVYQTGTNFSTIAGTASKNNITYSAGTLTIENKTGGTISSYRFTLDGRPG